MVKLRNFRSKEKIRIAKCCEINIAKKLPFFNENSILPKYCQFQKIFAKNLP